MSDVDVAHEPPARSRARRIAAIGATTIVLLGVLGITTVLLVDDGNDAPTALISEPVAVAVTTSTVSATTSTSTTSTTTSTTTTTPPTTSTSTVPPTVATTAPLQLTQPIAPPQDSRGPEDLGQIGSIAIPKIGVDTALHEGIRLTTLDRGPGHWPGSAMPGQVGNTVIAGHRTSHNADFRNIDDLAPGDLVTFTTADGIFDYAVTSTEIVGPEALWIIDPSTSVTATLFACHPPGSTRQRIVVHLELIGAD